jgi:hypothetical protein
MNHTSGEAEIIPRRSGVEGENRKQQNKSHEDRGARNPT